MSSAPDGDGDPLEGSAAPVGAKLCATPPEKWGASAADELNCPSVNVAPAGTRSRTIAWRRSRPREVRSAGRDDEIDGLGDDPVLKERLQKIADVVGDDLRAAVEERHDVVGEVGLASLAVAKASAAPGATSWTICSIARPSSVPAMVQPRLSWITWTPAGRSPDALSSAAPPRQL